MADCSIDGCDQNALARGWCRKHYDHWDRHGDPLAGRFDLGPRAGKTCEVDGCGEDVFARTYCKRHYDYWYRYRNPARADFPAASTHVRPVVDRECSVDGCGNAVASRGWCPRHYQRWMKYGDPLAGPPFRRQRGTGLPRWAYWQRRDDQRLAADGEVRTYIGILYRDPCAHCGAPCREIDHIVPVNAGGQLAVDNVTASCRSCNGRKHSMPLLRFLLHSREGVMS